MAFGQEHGEGPVGQPARQVVIYTSPACYWCRVAKRYCDEQEISYVEVDILADKEGRREMVLMTGQNGVPVVRVGTRAMVGWNAEEFEKLRSERLRHR